MSKFFANSVQNVCFSLKGEHRIESCSQGMAIALSQSGVKTFQRAIANSNLKLSAIAPCNPSHQRSPFPRAFFTDAPSQSPATATNG
ncbi:MAG: hypothetical protein HC899_30090 [Leptolyngbyaceae cyanobacterium SM1_4_3]|nr:hypothetical protein [Leptolyngbyaceae cyanobacterium SM1_4_3]